MISVYFSVVGVYLSKNSDLLQMNPFEVGSFGDMIIFKVMRVSFLLLTVTWGGSLVVSLSCNPEAAGLSPS